MWYSTTCHKYHLQPVFNLVYSFEGVKCTLIICTQIWERHPLFSEYFWKQKVFLWVYRICLVCEVVRSPDLVSSDQHVFSGRNSSSIWTDEQQLSFFALLFRGHLLCKTTNALSNHHYQQTPTALIIFSKIAFILDKSSYRSFGTWWVKCIHLNHRTFISFFRRKGCPWSYKNCPCYVRVLLLRHSWKLLMFTTWTVQDEVIKLNF